MKLQLIDNWAKIWWRRWSTWAAGINASVSAPIIAHQMQIMGLLPYLRGAWQIGAIVVLGLVLIVVPVLISLIPQKNIEAIKADAAND